MKTSNEILLELQLFADGAAAGAGMGVSGSAAGSQGDSGDLSNVQYGISYEDDSADDTPAEPAADDSTDDFDSLIKGKYKEAYDSRVQDIVQRRVRGMQGTVDAYNRAMPLIEAMAQKYGIDDPNNIDAIVDALDADDKMLEEEAEALNMPTEQLRNMRKLERENKAFRNRERQAELNRQADEQAAQWEQQAAAARSLYPALDMQAELQNPKFATFLRNGLDVQTAYEIIHKDEIMTAGMQYATKQAAEKVARSVAAGAKRPSEGGNGAGVAAIHKTDPTSLTRNDMKEIYRRVARGERVSFG